MKNPYANYKNTQVATASREKILLMMYEGAIKFTKLANKALQNNNLPEKGLMIGRAMDIIFELKNTLDFEVGKEIAVQLESIYTYIIDELTNANINNEAKHFDNVIGILETLYTGWQEAVKNYLKDKDQKKEGGDNERVA